MTVLPMLFLAVGAAFSASPVESSRKGPQLSMLPAGDVKPRGWIFRQMDLDLREGLAGKLSEGLQHRERGDLRPQERHAVRRLRVSEGQSGPLLVGRRSRGQLARFGRAAGVPDEQPAIQAARQARLREHRRGAAARARRVHRHLRARRPLCPAHADDVQQRRAVDAEPLVPGHAGLLRIHPGREDPGGRARRPSIARSSTTSARKCSSRAAACRTAWPSPTRWNGSTA